MPTTERELVGWLVSKEEIHGSHVQATIGLPADDGGEVMPDALPTSVLIEPPAGVNDTITGARQGTPPLDGDTEASVIVGWVEEVARVDTGHVTVTAGLPRGERAALRLGRLPTIVRLERPTTEYPGPEAAHLISLEASRDVTERPRDRGSPAPGRDLPPGTASPRLSGNAYDDTEDDTDTMGINITPNRGPGAEPADDDADTDPDPDPDAEPDTTADPIDRIDAGNKLRVPGVAFYDILDTFPNGDVLAEREDGKRSPVRIRRRTLERMADREAQDDDGSDADGDSDGGGDGDGNGTDYGDDGYGIRGSGGEQ